MAEGKDDFLNKFLTPSRKEAFFSKKTKTVKVQRFPSFTLEDANLEELLERTLEERNSARPAASSESSMTLGNMTTALIQNTLERAQNSSSAEDKQALKGYSRELTEAQDELNFVDAGWEDDSACNPVAKRHLEEAVLRLQGLVLQGPPSFRILMESLKELSQEVDRLITTNGSCAIENQEINNICREIKIESDRILEPYNAARENEGVSTVTDETVYEVVALEKVINGLMEKINNEIQKLPESNDKIVLNSQLINLKGKHIILSFASQSIIASNRLAILNKNFQDILNIERKINQMCVQLKQHSTSNYSKSTLTVLQIDLLRAMFSVVSQRHLGGVLMQFIDGVLGWLNYLRSPDRLEEDLRRLIFQLKKLFMMTYYRVIHWKDYHDENVTSVMKLEIQLTEATCFVYLPRWKTTSSIDLLTAHTTLILDKDEEKKIEDLQEWATQMTLSMVRDIDFICTGVRGAQRLVNVQEAAGHLAWTARTLKRPNDPVYNARIEEAVREMIFQTIQFSELCNRAMPKQQQQIAVGSRYERPIFHEMQFDEEMVDIQQTRMEAGPLKVRPPPSTMYSASTVEVGVTTGRLAETFPQAIFHPQGIVYDAITPDFGDMPPPSRSNIVSSGRYRPVECAGKYSEPVYVVETKSSDSVSQGIGEGSHGGYDGGSGGTIGGYSGGSSGGGSGVGSGEGNTGMGSGEGNTGSQGGVQSPSGANVSSPPAPNYTRVLEAGRSLNEAINNVCRITSQNRMRSDCGELVRNLLLQGALLESRLPTSALSYDECLHAMEGQKEVTPMLNSEDPMPMVAFWRTLRFISAAVCKCSELAAQCAYLILVSESDPEAPRSGVVDVRELQDVLKGAQDTCYKMLPLQPEQAKEESFRLIKQVQHIVKALTDAGRRVHRLKAELDASVLEVHMCAMDLSGSFEHSDMDEAGEDSPNYEERISAATRRMLNRLQAVSELTEHPALTPAVPASGSVSDDARSRCDQVLTAAKYLTTSTLSLVQNVKNRCDYVDDDETISWAAFELQRSAVVFNFEGLLEAVRANGEHVSVLS